MTEKREAIFEDKEEVCMEEACDVEEAIEQFDEKAFYEKKKEYFKKIFEREELREKQRELTKKAREEVLKELGKEVVEDDSPIRYECCSKTSEVSDEYYKQLVEDISRLTARNVQIIAIFTDKKAIKDAAENGLSGTMVEEYLNNEATLHTLLDRIQSINIDIHIGENFRNSVFGSVSKRMSDR